MTEEKQEKGISRRKFLKTSTVVAVGGAVVYGVASVPLLRSDRVLLRPPGALDEDSFLAACIKCGQCLQVCPPQVIELAGIRQGFGIGTPFIVPREGGCILCAGLPCVLACPTGALDHHISEGKEAEMGLAVISQPDTCLSILGVNDLAFRLDNLNKSENREKAPEELRQVIEKLLKRMTPEEKQNLKTRYNLTMDDAGIPVSLAAKVQEADALQLFTTYVRKTIQAETGCRICLEECPIKQEQTIRFISRKNDNSGKYEVWPLVQETCVGCGLCEEKCPTAKASITIVPRKKWKAHA
jgi:ferredoxin-type protein NapG